MWLVPEVTFAYNFVWSSTFLSQRWRQGWMTWYLTRGRGWSTWKRWKRRRSSRAVFFWNRAASRRAPFSLLMTFWLIWNGSIFSFQWGLHADKCIGDCHGEGSISTKPLKYFQVHWCCATPARQYWMSTKLSCSYKDLKSRHCFQWERIFDLDFHCCKT